MFLIYFQNCTKIHDIRVNCCIKKTLSAYIKAKHPPKCKEDLMQTLIMHENLPKELMIKQFIKILTDFFSLFLGMKNEFPQHCPGPLSRPME